MIGGCVQAGSSVKKNALKPRGYIQSELPEGDKVWHSDNHRELPRYLQYPRIAALPESIGMQEYPFISSALLISPLL